MCGRFTLAVDPADLQAAFPDFTFPAKIIARYNIAPSQPILVLPNDGKQRADYYTWGLVPVWSKDPTIGSHMINARAETLAEKSAFRGAYKYKRCLIFADGFYEGKALSGSNQKIPYHICLSSGMPFAMAGLWDEWLSSDGSQIRSCSIITTEPNSLMSTLHNRMPVILPIDVYAEWLNPEPQKPEALQHLLGAYPAAEMTAHPVSGLVNRPSNDRPELIAPIPGDTTSRDPKRDFS